MPAGATHLAGQQPQECFNLSCNLDSPVFVCAGISTATKARTGSPLFCATAYLQQPFGVQAEYRIDMMRGDSQVSDFPDGTSLR